HARARAPHRARPGQDVRTSVRGSAHPRGPGHGRSRDPGRPTGCRARHRRGRRRWADHRNRARAPFGAAGRPYRRRRARRRGRGRSVGARGHPVVLNHPHSVADKLVAKSTEALNVALATRYADDFVTVSDRDLERASYEYLESLSLLVEPSGAAPLAAVRAGRVDPRGRRTVLVVSG